ncbi:MAG: Thioredoxin reductase [candidate division WWE3 bacterium GW2011_GWA1_46_21]|uniref:Thioredoxin reductase n=2 Tax=Katanobacteria TaxID=422282 RepID=A0A0G1PDI7_UNCKA|nr:MAG: Thioredoxin reductase [candidate division WWE3 bacterium GW2011_GWA1_46_21]KKU50336.1 MAG: Thioredoxin reductase, thioredoxin reductase (NADPH) [candidate division WWE3 bacterium GW2011_GWC1_47_10]
MLFWARRSRAALCTLGFEEKLRIIVLMQGELYDVLILGSGPSGLTAAIYTARAALKSLVVAGCEPGGQLMHTTDVENFPGFPNGVLGPQLIQEMRTQAEKFGVVFVNEDAAEVSGSVSQHFTVKTSEGKQFVGKCVIVATGASAKWLGLESEQRLWGKGVSGCATCDGFFFKDNVVAVVGGGDSAMEESLFLTRFASKVYVLVRTDQAGMRASKILQSRALSNPKVEFSFNTEVAEVLGSEKVSGVNIKNNKTGEERALDVEGLFVAIGHKPNTSFLKGFISVGDTGYVTIDMAHPQCKHHPNCTLTSKEGIFVAGDVYDYKYRQAVTAAGFGCMAAIDAERFLANLDS